MCFLFYATATHYIYQFLHTLSLHDSRPIWSFFAGQMYSWRDGEDVLFDETFVHCAENRSAHDRIIFFCDVERPLRPRWLGYLNRAVSGVLGRATDRKSTRLNSSH